MSLCEVRTISRKWRLL